MRLAIFIPDTSDLTETETIGTGEVLYIHFKVRRGLLSKKRLLRYLEREAEGAYTFDAYFARLLALSTPRGEVCALIHAVFPRLVPEGTVQLSLFPGEGYREEAVLTAARRVQFLELVGDAALSPLADRIEAETGLVVPIVASPHEEENALFVRLPGAKAGAGLDLTTPEALSFLPPPALRRVTSFVGTDASVLAALLPFFGFTHADVDVFCKKL